MSAPRPALLPLLFLFVLLTAARSQATGSAASDEGDPCPASQDAPSCPINCFRADPVCGANGVTYWCGCPDAACAGVRVVHRGSCQVGSGGAAPVTGQALLLLHIVWLFVLGFSVLFGLL